YKITSFADIQRIFSENADQDLKPYFNQWTQRSGAPELSVVGTAVKNTAQGYELSMTLAQTQAGKPYRLYVPVVISLQDSSEPFNTAVVLSSAQETFSLPLAARPIRIDVDPGFDIFRRLDVREIPSALSQGFGAEKPLIVLPSKARQALLTAYKKLALDWQKNRNKNISIILDSDLAQLPGNRTVWLLGWENRFIDVFKKSTHKQIEVVSSESASIAGHTYDKKKHSLVVTARQAQNIEHSLLWVATDNVAAITGLGRKLPHYGKYSYLAFEGDAPTNIAKGQWSVGDSPLAKQLDDGGSAPPSWVARAPLVSLPPLFSKQRMMKDISYLASKELKGRELGSKGLDQAAKYIAGEFKKAGLLPGGDAGKSFYQEWQQDVGKPRGKVTLKNVIAVLPGSNPGLQKQSLVISAHYDHLGQGWPNVHAGDEGKIHYGADDNASGVAVMLEFARQVAKKWRPERAIVFIAFTGEESALMGSDFYIKHAQQYPAKNVSSVLNLDMVGRLDDKPLTIFGVGTASELVHVFRGIGYVTGIKLNSVANDIGSSDHTRFVDIGVPGVQFFSGVHSQFHRPGDTVNKIDADGLVKVARVLKESAEYLANRIEPLTIKINAQLAKFPASTAINSRNSRKVRLGTIPDFAYQGTGVRIDGVSANSPAANAGLKAGDILLGINGSKIADLSSMSRALGALNAGEEIKVDYKRAGKPAAVTVRVDNR
ncbi:MAG: M20/M25/M40 family metallo-hydrolase, partial [Thiohalomonadales bacterium]